MLKLSQSGPVETPYPFQAHFCVFLTCPQHALSTSSEHFLAQKDIAGSFYTFPAMALELDISSESPGSF